MFGIGSTELLVILLVALIVMGPRKLPQIARSMGKAFGEFKRVSSGFKETIDVEVRRAERQEEQARAKRELRVDDVAPAGEEGASGEPVSPELATPTETPSAKAGPSPEESFEAEFDDDAAKAAETPEAEAAKDGESAGESAGQAAGKAEKA